MSRSNRTGGHGTLGDRDMNLPGGNTITNNVIWHAARFDARLQTRLNNATTPVNNKINVLDTRFICGMHRTQYDGSSIDGMDFLRGQHHRPTRQEALVDWCAHGWSDQFTNGIFGCDKRYPVPVKQCIGGR